MEKIKRFLLKIEDSLKHSFIKYSRSYLHLREAFTPSDCDLNIKKAMEFIRMNRIKGDYAEFGVATGGSFIAIYHYGQLRRHQDIKLYAFDTFSGLPKPKSTDSNFDLWKEGDYACSVKNFKKRLKKAR